MTRKEIAEEVSRRTGYDYKKVANIFSTIIDVINESVLKGINISIKNLCTFKINEREPYIAKNPKTGEDVMVPARYILKIEVPQKMKRKFKDKKVWRGEN